MNSRFAIMLIIAVVMAGGAAWLAKRWVDSQTGNVEVAHPDTTSVVVAAAKIPFATRIEATHIKLMEWPKDNVPEGAFTELEPVIGKVTQRDFYANEILLQPQVTDHVGGSTLSAIIEQGKRAMSVRVDDVVGVAGFILPGNRADIIATRREGSTYTLLRNIKVLAIDQTASRDQDKPAVVRALTLEVTPQQAEKLVQAMKTGTLQFTLRNPMDDSEVNLAIKEDTPAPAVKRKVVRYSAPAKFKVIRWP